MRPAWPESVLWGILFASFTIFVLLSAFYVMSTGDEGAYFYQARLLSEGLVPTKDFFATHPIGFYGVYAVFIKALSPHLESGRLFGVISILATVAMGTALVRRDCGLIFGIAAFFVLAFNWDWIILNLWVIHYSPANLGYVAALFLISYPDRLAGWRVIMAGLMFGLAVNSRLPLAISGLFLVWILWRRHRGNADSTGAGFMRFLLLAAAGTLVASIPSIALFANDPDRFMFNHLLNRIDWIEQTVVSGMGAGERMAWELQHRALALGEFLFRTPQNLVISSPAVAFVFLALVSAVRGREPWRHWLPSSRIVDAGIAGIGIVVAYMPANYVLPGYFSHALLPFAVFSLGVIHRWCGLVTARRVMPLTSTAAILAGMIVTVSLLAYSSVAIAKVSMNVLLRHAPGVTRVLTVTRLGCWLEANTAADDIVFSTFALPVAVSGRRSPFGWEQSLIFNDFWPHWRPEIWEKYRFLSIDELRRQLTDGRIAIVLDESTFAADLVVAGFSDYATILRTHYSKIGDTGGPSAYTVYATPRWLAEHPSAGGLPKDDDPLENRLSGWRREPQTLFEDIRGSISRLLGLGFEARCGRLLASGPGTPVER